MNRPYEWLALLIGVVGIDIYYYKSQKRQTLSAAVKGLNKDPVARSLMWAMWGWLTYHWFFEGD